MNCKLMMCKKLCMPFIGNVLKTNFTKVRLISNSKLNHCSLNESKTVTTNNDEDWCTIYQLPSIRLAAAMNKLKIYQAIFTGTTICTSLGLEYYEIVPAGATQIVGALGISGTVTLFIMAAFSSNLIGFIYLNNHDLDRLKLSYINFWGKRKNVELSVKDVIPFSELPKKRLSFYVPIKTYSDKKAYTLLHTLGHISDFTKFSYIFGDE